MLRAALIGCGNIGAGGHLPAYAHIPEAELVAVCDAVEDLVRAAAERSGATAFADYQQLLARDDIDMVDICLPTYLHGEVATAAAEAGKHILCEKPMALSAEAADAMIEAAQKARVKLMIGQVRRFDHRYASIKEQIDAVEPQLISALKEMIEKVYAEASGEDGKRMTEDEWQAFLKDVGEITIKRTKEAIAEARRLYLTGGDLGTGAGQFLNYMELLAGDEANLTERQKHHARLFTRTLEVLEKYQTEAEAGASGL